MHDNRWPAYKYNSSIAIIDVDLFAIIDVEMVKFEFKDNAAMLTGNETIFIAL